MATFEAKDLIDVVHFHSVTIRPLFMRYSIFKIFSLKIYGQGHDLNQEKYSYLCYVSVGDPNPTTNKTDTKSCSKVTTGSNRFKNIKAPQQNRGQLLKPT